MNLFFDTETTGVPDKRAHWEVDYDLFPYIASVAWSTSDGKNHYYLIHQEGRKMPKEAEAIHGISTSMSNSSATKPFETVLPLLLKDAAKCSNIIGHNLYFDVAMLKANVIRKYGKEHNLTTETLSAFHKDKRLDTMRNMTRYFGKWPKLEELHQFLFGKEIVGAHNALTDVLATERCFNEMKKRKMI
jgi:DNA polymerase III epsilon subunit-like protein